MLISKNESYAFYETTFTVEFQWTTTAMEFHWVTIGGEPALYCPAAKEYIPARCCPHYCSKKRSCTARR